MASQTTDANSKFQFDLVIDVDALVIASTEVQPDEGDSVRSNRNIVDGEWIVGNNAEVLGTETGNEHVVEDGIGVFFRRVQLDGDEDFLCAHDRSSSLDQVG